jgi:hypothetical protein
MPASIIDRELRKTLAIDEEPLLSSIGDNPDGVGKI